jgi:hypothetical protein
MKCESMIIFSTENMLIEFMVFHEMKSQTAEKYSTVKIFVNKGYVFSITYIYYYTIIIH